MGVRLAALLVPDNKLDCFGFLEFFEEQNGLAFYPGPVLPPSNDGSPIISVVGPSKQALLSLALYNLGNEHR